MDELARRGFVAAREYERGRPSYAASAVERVVSELRIDGRSRVLDLAAGTGKLTRLLLPVAGSVLAVEPAAAMRAVLASRFGSEVQVVDAVAERLPLADAVFDAVVVGEAFHWFDGSRALAEIARVLRPGGGLALLWNVEVASEPPWPEELRELIGGYRRAAVPDRSRYPAGDWRSTLDASAAFGPVDSLGALHEQRLDGDGFVAQIASWSYIASLPDDERRSLLERVRELAPPSVVTTFRTDAFWTHRH